MTERRWIFLAGMLVVLSFLVGIVSVSNRYIRKSRDWELRGLESEVARGSEQILSHFSAVRSDLLRIDRYLANSNMEAGEEFLSLLQLIRSRDPRGIPEILVLDIDGNVISSTNPASLNRVIRSSNFFIDSVPLANVVYLSDVIVLSDFFRLPMVRSETDYDPLDLGWLLYSGVYSGGEYKGTTLFVLRGEPFFNLLSDVLNEPFTGHGFIVQEDGRVLFHRQVELRGKHLSELPESVELSAVSDLVGTKGTKFFMHSVLGERMVATSTIELENQHWTIGAITRTPQVAQETRQLIFALSGGMLVLVVIVILLLLSIIRIDQASGLLAESERRLRALFDGAPDAIFLADQETGEILDANPAAEKMILRTHKEIVGLHQSQLHPQEVGEYARDGFQTHVDTEGARVPIEITVLRSDGNWIPVEVMAETVQIKGRPVLQGVFRDITKRKKTEGELKRSQAQLRELSHYLLTAREEERAHIAREIHDELGQALTALNMDLSWMSKRLPAKVKSLRQKTASMRELVDSTIQSVRRIATSLRPGMLDDLGLVAAMEWQAQEFSDRTGVECNLDLPEDVSDLNRDQETALFRIFQETLTNVARHAGANQVWVDLRGGSTGLTLIVRDNGRGITEEQIGDPRSLGLLGMNERVRQWGGRVDVQGVPNQGTTLKVHLPRDYF